MPVVWKKGSPAEFRALGQKIIDQLYIALAGEMVGLAEQAAITARAYTAQRGRRTSRGGGRIDEGTMVEAIKSEVELSAKTIIGRFGFIGAQADYFLYQTVLGFEHWLSGEMIEPTFALRDARVKAEPEVYKAIEKAIRSVHL